MLTYCRLAILAMCVFTAPSSAEAAPDATGEVRGIVTDGSGAGLPSVTVTITHVPTKYARETLTDARGFFAAPGLPPGDYEVQASAQGYATRRQSSLIVHGGRVVTLRLELTMAPAPETITMAAAPPVVDASRSEIATAIDPDEVEHLPLRGRNALHLALLAPAASLGSDGAVALAGQPAAFNRLLVDGAELAGAIDQLSWISAEATQDVRLTTHAYPAEHGRATGGLIHAATRSGSNDLNGSVFGFAGGAAPDGSSREFGGSVGGPLERDRHFAYGVYHGRRVRADNPVRLNLPAGLPEDAGTRAGLARLQGFADTWDRTLDRDFLLVKTNHRLSDAHALTARFERTRVTSTGGDTAQPHVSAGAAFAADRSIDVFTGAATSVIGPALVNEGRAYVGRDRSDTLDDGAPHAIVRHLGTDVLRIGTDPRASAARLTRFGVADTITWLRGAHEVRVGLALQVDRVRALAPGPFAGAYEFESLASFGRTAPFGAGDLYVQAFEGAGTSGRETRPHATEYSFFVQDAWAVTREITVHAGLRYDAQTFAGPAVTPSDTNNLAPRTGVAWAPLDERIVVRAGYGLMFGRTPWQMVSAARAYDGASVQTFVVPAARGPAFPARLDSPPRGAVGPAAIAFASDYEAPRVHQASAGVEWEWMPHTAAAAHFVTARGNHLPRAVELAAGAAAGRTIAYESTGRSRYDGLTFELTRRLGQGHRYRVSYTIARARDTLAAGIPLVPHTLHDRWSAPAGEEPALTTGAADRRHRLAASVVYQSNRFADRFDGLTRALARDWNLSAVYVLQSGAPFSGYVNGDLNGDGNRYNDLAPGATRNEHRLPRSGSVDGRAARDFALKGDTRLTLLWEAFNLFDKLNAVAVNDAQFDLAGSQLRANPLFGEPFLYAEPRTMHVAVRLAF